MRLSDLIGDRRKGLSSPKPLRRAYYRRLNACVESLEGRRLLAADMDFTDEAGSDALPQIAICPAPADATVFMTGTGEDNSEAVSTGEEAFLYTFQSLNGLDGEVVETVDPVDDPHVVFYSLGGTQDDTSAEDDSEKAIDIQDNVETSLDDVKTMSATGISVRSWSNSSSPTDVNGDGSVTPIDILFVVNALNRFANAPASRISLGALEAAGGEGTTIEGFVDVSQDGYLTALDALLLINYFNQAQDQSLASELAAPNVARVMADSELSEPEENQEAISDDSVDASFASDATMVGKLRVIDSSDVSIDVADSNDDGVTETNSPLDAEIVDELLARL